MAPAKGKSGIKKSKKTLMSLKVPPVLENKSCPSKEDLIVSGTTIEDCEQANIMPDDCKVFHDAPPPLHEESKGFNQNLNVESASDPSNFDFESSSSEAIHCTENINDMKPFSPHPTTEPDIKSAESSEADFDEFMEAKGCPLTIATRRTQQDLLYHIKELLQIPEDKDFDLSKVILRCKQDNKVVLLEENQCIGGHVRSPPKFSELRQILKKTRGMVVTADYCTNVHE